MPDVTVKLADGIREITVEINGSNDDPLAHAEETAVRLYGIAVASSPLERRAGFGDWTLSSDTERSDEE
ncbi:VCBS domain-containing protein [Streptomyces sp. NPDC016640]|uniref:VCBS domain-containing protein n=1 Tax=Streptomyces sp. NPDC016640 TaxID=3364969 RepID=UPI0036FBA902